MLCQIAWEIDTYGASVVAAYGEYCGHQRRILARRPRLRYNLAVLSKMIILLMKG